MNYPALFSLVSQLVTGADPTVEAIPGRLLASGSVSTTTITNNEVVYIRTNNISDSVGSQFRLGLSGDFQPVSYTALTPAIATVDAAGNTTYVADGIAQFRVVGEALATGQRRGFIISQTISETATTLTNLALLNFEAGSLSESISNGMAAKLDGLSVSTSIVDVYSTRTYPGTFVRNTNFWLAGVTGLTGVATCQGPSVTAISPRHAIGVQHYAPGVGATVNFVTADNTLVSRTITSRSQVVNASQFGGGDLCVLLLSSDLPESIEFVKIISGAAFTNKIPATANTAWSDNQAFQGRKLPTVVFNQFDRAYVRELKSVTTLTFTAGYPTDWFPTWGVTIVSGDSGKPVMLLVENELVLIGGWTFSGAGYPLGLSTSAINAAMSDLSTAAGATVYTLAEYDLSTFNTY